MTRRKRQGKESVTPSAGEVLLYRTEDGSTRIECRFAEGTVWLTQALIAELYQTTVANVNAHLRRLYEDGELAREATIKDYLIVRSEGGRQVSRRILHYNLQTILAVGYRVETRRGVQFRQWATARLEEYLRKGFVLDDQRLKNPPGPGVPDYFDELLERIRDIRASERRVYLRLREILALAADYQPKDEETQVFFQTVQNKLHFAVSGRTAAEIVWERADHTKPNMGLTSWKGTAVRKADVAIAKNYLNEPEISELNRIVNMFLDFAEDQAKRRKQIFLSDWRVRLDEFLRFHERGILPNAGRVSHEDAERRATEQYDLYAQIRREQIEADEMRALEQTIRKLPKRKK